MGIKITLNISAINASRRSSRELAKSRDYLQDTLTLQLQACAPHVAFNCFDQIFTT